MGAVWVAEHTTLNTKVAVKFISDRLDPDDEEVFERFVREASTAAQIKSSHVVQTFDQGVMRDGTPYIVMEYLEGVELSERLVREGQLPLGEVVRIIAQTAKALGSAHKVGIIHRDIKPDNIFLSTRDDELHVKVFDFGIAKIRHPQLHEVVEVDLTAQLDDQAKMGLTNDGAILGTPEFMSPEAVMSASNVDHHADLWGLAVVAYVCIVGELPFKGKDVGELCVNLLDCKYKPVTQLRPDAPPELDDFFATALSRNVEDRYQTARDLAQALAAALPSASLPHHDALLTSGAWEARPSARGPLASAPPSEDSNPSISLVGIKSDSISGATADAARMGRRRWSTSAVGGAVAAVLLVGGVAAFLMAGSGEQDQGTVLPASPSAAAAAAEPTTDAEDDQASEEEEAGDTAEPETTAEPVASASASVDAKTTAPPKPVAPRPRYMPRRRRGPKDPGF
jgi:serine/threonine-protein kinase